MILWVWWFVVVFGGVVVVVQWVWYRLFGRFSVVCCMNGGGFWCFVGFVVVV